MYKYETHLHTYPVSRCAHVGVRENLECYKQLGYDGIFITNHFIDGNVNIDDRDIPYADKINFYFSDYEEAVGIGEELGLKVFCGVEISYRGTDFLVYGLDKQWFLDHPQIMDMKKSDELKYLVDSGALVIQAHPFREASYIDHIRLFPRCVHGVEVINACRNEFENGMAKLYAERYGLIEFAGSDNHLGKDFVGLAGMCAEFEISSVDEFIEAVKNGKMKTFGTSYEPKK